MTQSDPFKYLNFIHPSFSDSYWVEHSCPHHQQRHQCQSRSLAQTFPRPGSVRVVNRQNCQTPAGASVDSYYLADYVSSAVQPPGKFKVLSMKAQATPAGRLQAYFEIVLTQTADALKSADLNVIYALGELAGEELQASCGSM